MTLNLKITHDGGDDYRAKIQFSDSEEGRAGDTIILNPDQSVDVVLWEGRSLTISEILITKKE